MSSDSNERGSEGESAFKAASRRALSRREFLKSTGKAAGAAAALYVIPTITSISARPAYAAGSDNGSVGNSGPGNGGEENGNPDVDSLEQQLLASAQDWRDAVFATFQSQGVLTPGSIEFERLAPTKQLTGSNTTRQDDVDLADAIAGATSTLLVPDRNVATATLVRDGIVELLDLVEPSDPSLGDNAFIGDIGYPGTWSIRDFDGDGILTLDDVDLWSQLITAWTV